MIKERSKEAYNKKKETKRKDVEALWETLVESKENGTMMGCSAEGETEGFINIDDVSSGIMSGHAYSIIDVFTLEFTEKEKETKKIIIIITDYLE